MHFYEASCLLELRFNYWHLRDKKRVEIFPAMELELSFLRQLIALFLTKMQVFDFFLLLFIHSHYVRIAYRQYLLSMRFCSYSKCLIHFVPNNTP